MHPKTGVEPTSKAKSGLSLEDLRIVPMDEDEDLSEEDADIPSVDTTMIDVAINLLLALLEGEVDVI
jgi:hypothetical protein